MSNLLTEALQQANKELAEAVDVAEAKTKVMATLIAAAEAMEGFAAIMKKIHGEGSDEFIFYHAEACLMGKKASVARAEGVAAITHARTLHHKAVALGATAKAAM